MQQGPLPVMPLCWCFQWHCFALYTPLHMGCNFMGNPWRVGKVVARCFTFGPIHGPSLYRTHSSPTD